jgi:prepilin-type N-terminal cleavage/methylation domain-containing protein
MRTIQTKNQRGFTLAELLVAVVIILLILTIVSSAFAVNQRVFRIGNNRAELLQNARIATDLMAREIRQALAITTTLPPDNTDPGLVAHELQFEDGHIVNQIQYIKYYLAGTDLKRQIVVYYFSSDPTTYVHWDDIDPFGGPEESVLEDRLIGEFYSQLDFYGENQIIIDLILDKSNQQVNMQTMINPRNS